MSDSGVLGFGKGLAHMRPHSEKVCAQGKYIKHWVFIYSLIVK